MVNSSHTPGALAKTAVAACQDTRRSLQSRLSEFLAEAVRWNALAALCEATAPFHAEIATLRERVESTHHQVMRFHVGLRRLGR